MFAIVVVVVVMRQQQKPRNVNNETVLAFRVSKREKAALLKLARSAQRSTSNMVRVLVTEALKARGVIKGEVNEQS